MFERTRKIAMGVAALGALALGGSAIAGAADNGSSSSSSGSTTTQTKRPDGGGHSVNGRTETPLTGGVKAKVQAAALARVPGTVERVETNVDSSAPYEAHIVKSDGTEVEVQVNKDFSVSAVNAMGDHHP